MPLTRLRTFRNTDPPRLASLWNRGLPTIAVARPLAAHEFDSLVLDKPHFDPAGLLVAEDDAGHVIGFAHAGFGPLDPCGEVRGRDTELGVMAMFVVDEERMDSDAEDALWLSAEQYLRSRGATVLYAGGQYPVNPFYWGIYGGSEYAGILSSHVAFHRVALRMGYEPTSTTAVLEANLSEPEPRDPRVAALRRQVRLDVDEDSWLDCWWDAAAIGAYRPTTYRLRPRNDETELASAITWDMDGFSRLDGRTRLGLIDVEVPHEQRRKGYGRFLVREIMREARNRMIDILCVQTTSTNHPALALYESIGFHRLETATLYRLPADKMGRSTPH
ncbi:GNAT family N-acetyltransferase [Isosphaeraceae bacterium EP7]